jgi:hypothetical protein
MHHLDYRAAILIAVPGMVQRFRDELHVSDVSDAGCPPRTRPS